MFSRSNLVGKQIWHITAPASIPVDMITQVSLESVAKGEAALSYNSTDYGFVVGGEGGQTPKKLLIMGAGSNYRLAPMDIAQTLQLQQLVKLPSLQLQHSQPSHASQGSTKASVPARKPIRQQPEGLRMRFDPLGNQIGRSGKIGLNPSSDESSHDEAGVGSEFRTPRNLEAGGESVKRKYSEVNGSSTKGVSSSQSTRNGKKAKRKKAKHDASQNTPNQQCSSVPNPSKDLDAANGLHSHLAVGSQQHDTPKKRKGTDQERKDRKAKEKRKAQGLKHRRAKGGHEDHKSGDKSLDHEHSKPIPA